MLRFDAKVTTFVGELCTNDSAFELGVLIVSAATANVYAFQDRSQLGDFTLESRARLLHVDGDISFRNRAVACAVFGP